LKIENLGSRSQGLGLGLELRVYSPKFQGSDIECSVPDVLEVGGYGGRDVDVREDVGHWVEEPHVVREPGPGFMLQASGCTLE